MESAGVAAVGAMSPKGNRDSEGNGPGSLSQLPSDRLGRGRRSTSKGSSPPGDHPAASARSGVSNPGRPCHRRTDQPETAEAATDHTHFRRRRGRRRTASRPSVRRGASVNHLTARECRGHRTSEGRARSREDLAHRAAGPAVARKRAIGIFLPIQSGLQLAVSVDPRQRVSADQGSSPTT